MSAARPLRTAFGVLCAAGLAAAGAGCGFSRDVYTTSGFAAPGTSYGEALARDTRHAELYKDLETVAKGWATWLSPELRRALAEAKIRAYGLEGAAAERARQEEEKAGEGAWTFHLALYTPEKNRNELLPPDSLWRARLVLGDGRELEPLKITLVPKSEKRLVEYPYVTAWTKEYELVFQGRPGEASERPVLWLGGPLGTLRFSFRTPEGKN